MNLLNQLSLVLGSVSLDKSDAPSFIEKITQLLDKIAGWAFIIAPSAALVLLVIAGILFMKASTPHKQEEVKGRFEKIIGGLIVVFVAVEVINFFVKTFAS
ncbi:pilin [Staphylococcus gallinarum]|uniref:pilin n=1 Tax=Staphylococcus gallinarum TaxID=1293 RepID=UPI0030C55DB9